MVNPVEQFTAPGKYYIELSFEKANMEREYKGKTENEDGFIGIKKAYFDSFRLFENNMYDSYPNSICKIKLVK